MDTKTQELIHSNILFTDMGSTICRLCQIKCCQNLNTIGYAFLTKKDIINISCGLKLSYDDFLHQFVDIKLKDNGVIIYYLKTKGTDQCIFFNEDNGICEIYQYRPLDCQIFPLDISFCEKTKEYFLVKHNICQLSDVITDVDIKSAILKIKETFTLDELKNYSQEKFYPSKYNKEILLQRIF